MLFALSTHIKCSSTKIIWFYLFKNFLFPLWLQRKDGQTSQNWTQWTKTLLIVESNTFKLSSLEFVFTDLILPYSHVTWCRPTDPSRFDWKQSGCCCHCSFSISYISVHSRCGGTEKFDRRHIVQQRPVKYLQVGLCKRSRAKVQNKKNKKQDKSLQTKDELIISFEFCYTFSRFRQ